MLEPRTIVLSTSKNAASILLVRLGVGTGLVYSAQLAKRVYVVTVKQSITLTLIAKPGCHLCDEAEEAVTRVLFGFRASHPGMQVLVEHRNILEDHDLAIKHGEEIPVLLIEGKMHSYWHIDEARLRKALDELAR